MVNRHIAPALGRLKLKALTPAHVRGLYREKLDAGLAPRTVQYIHLTLHKALKQAVMDGLIPRNVTEAVKVPQAHKKEVRPLTPAVHTGLRRSEILGLKWTNVDLERGSLRARACR